MRPRSSPFHLLRPLALGCALSVAALFAAPALAQQCKTGVTSGFTGDVDATYSDGYAGGGGGGDGGGGAGDGGSGAGAGAGEGKVLGGLMTVTRLADGVVLGTALTDGVRGLVAIKPCLGDFPVLLTLESQPGARYFDEGTNQLSDFSGNKVLHALVDTLDENVAVSPLTEAAYRYALNNYILNPQDVRTGLVPLAATGNLTGLTLAQVRAANAVVLNELNRVQTTGMRLATIKSLPTPIDNLSPATALPNNRYGVAAAVLGGLASMARDYVASNATPALAASEQFARDLTDGKLDGFGLDGKPAAVATGVLSYDAVRFPIAASIGANAIAARFGLNTTLPRAASVAERTTMEGGSWTVCDESEDAATLLKDGSLTVTRTPCNGSPAALANFATQVRLVEGSGDFEAPRTFFVKRDGTVWGWGDTLCGLLGNGETARKFKATPVQIAGLHDVTSIAIGSWFALARDDTGSVYSWGINYIGELGVGLYGPANAFNCINDYTVPQFRSSNAVATPTKITALSDIVTVAVDRVTGYALDRSGGLFRWGLIPTGYNFAAPDPYFGEYLTQPIPAKVTGLPPVVSIASSYYMAMALAADGTLWGFGPNIIGNFGDGTLAPHLVPAQVPGITGVVEMAGMKESPFVALLQDGTIRYWGGCCTSKDQSIPAYIRKVPTAPVPGQTPFWSAISGASQGTLPPIRHIKASSGTILLYGVDGSLYQFPKSQTEQVFVVLPTDGGGPSFGAATTTVVEYYNASLDHYFVTWVPAEQANLDAGNTPTRWNRTGQSFKMYATAQAGTSPVCRYYIPPAKGDSHFFGRGTAECNATGANNPTFVLEDPAFMQMVLPTLGTCPAGTQIVYRVFSNRADANHRYMTDRAIRDQMVAKGWLAEGDGPDLVVMCAPT